MAELGTDLQASIEAYLLGRLPPDDQARIEAQLFEDDDVFEAIRDGEDELIDRYVAGELAPADREAFERAFATSASRQERIALARALSQGAASSTPASARPPAAADAAPARRARSFAARRFLVPAAAILAAAIVIAVVWWPWPPGDAVHGPSDGPAVATLALGRGESRRGAGNLPRLALPDGTTAIVLLPQLEAAVPGGDHAVTLRRVEGLVVWQATARADERGRVTVTVPSRLVAPGDYVLSVATPGAPPEDSAEYPFRILARD